MGSSRLRRSPPDRHLRLRGADADRTAHWADRARGAKGSVKRRSIPRTCRPAFNAHKFTRHNIFNELAALLRNFCLHQVPAPYVKSRELLMQTKVAQKRG